MTDDYRGVLGAVPYAFRASDSRLFRSYALLGGLLAAATALLFLAAVVVVVAGTAGGGGTLTLSRAFFVLVGLLVVAPLLAPILFVARRRRRRPDARNATAYDAALGAAGYAFVAALYVGLVASVPPGQQSTPTGPLAPVVTALYGLPQPAGLVPPVVTAAAIPLVHRLLD
jgi:cytochrome c biogenesis factor